MLLTHGDSVEKVAENFKSIANSSTNISGIANEKAHIYGIQFHPEVEKNTISIILFLNNFFALWQDILYLKPNPDVF